ncbi:hypothetical protein CC1G_04728 [Coprinopsis cinerea okayama7|uniref:Uncharacterized protein n=1 Tax=Coprinopsis cinerea (strain Okayama-7 / 130 / ATCC MYA-4618 / FGSC 9003) TaxID=240176 RepID=A8P2C3_COPC7|nr:hypothetical protein CC1G_04728 [Coprinopsis cinerea okayama7\|eukprot:XP_001838284.2 hypothetical protein CC1G_04728 [Coprinopsis cinerea okayama7\
MARKSDRRTAQPSFPWDLLKAECLRTICHQLQWKRYNTTKSQMVEFLKTVEQHGVEHALNEYQEKKGEEDEDEANTSSTPEIPPSRRQKRKRQPEPEPSPSPEGQEAGPSREPYNTRHKGSKHVATISGVREQPRPVTSPAKLVQTESASTVFNPPRRDAPPPRKRGRPRKNPVKGEHASVSASTSVPAQPKRKRGRPRKQDAEADVKREKAQSTLPKKGNAEVFDGVVLTPLRRPSTTDRGHDHGEDADADGEEIDENDEYIVVPSGAESSLASSNKENHDTFVPPDPSLRPPHVTLHETIADAINAAAADQQLGP